MKKFLNQVSTYFQMSISFYFFGALNYSVPKKKEAMKINHSSFIYIFIRHFVPILCQLDHIRQLHLQT